MDFNNRYMQMLMMVTILLVHAGPAHAQTWNEWWRQRKTQLQYLERQIQALKAYGAVVNKGYAIAENGLTNVFLSKEGDYRQHSDYFLSLWTVKEGVKSYSKVPGVFTMKSGIEKQYRIIRVLKSDLGPEEQQYINVVFARLLAEASDLSDQLRWVTSDRNLSMKDDERLQRIDNIFSEMQDRYLFARSFVNDIRTLVLQRREEQHQAGRLQSLYGIK